MGKPASLTFVLSDGRRADEAGAAFLMQSAAVAAVGDDLAVVQEPVEDHGGDDRIAEHGRELGGRVFGRRSRGDRAAPLTLQSLSIGTGAAPTELGSDLGAAPHTVPEHDCRGIMAPDADRVHGLKVASGAVAISTTAAAAASFCAPCAAGRS